jgi:hypothetical protein
VAAVFKAIKETSGVKVKFPQVNIEPKNSKITAKNLDAVFGKPGDLNGGVYKFTFAKKTEMDGHPMGAAMGVNTWAAFAGDDKKAVVDGDFAMFEGELQNVLKTLRSHGIEIVAIHNHMTGENPRVVFLHFWGVGEPVAMAQAIKAALP